MVYKMNSIKYKVQQAIADSLQQMDNAIFADIKSSDVLVERTKDTGHGDYASNIALMLAKKANMSPRDLAGNILAGMQAHKLFDNITIAGPGFINFTMAPGILQSIIPSILQQKHNFGLAEHGVGKSIHLEYVSANPTGPLHVGHGRGAAFGSCVASMLKAVGFDVHQEYYVNDAGRQMKILGISVWFRMQELRQVPIALPASAYQGGYITDIAKCVLQEGNVTEINDMSWFDDLSAQYDQNSADAFIDACIDQVIAILGDDEFERIRRFSLESILDDIKNDLGEFGVNYDEWFYESKLMHDGLLDASLKLLQDHGYVYEKNGATWFKSTEFDDDKDRVLVRENGHPTYFASDVAYHLYKYRQGYDQMIDIFGADHHGYIARINAFLHGLGEDPGRLKILLVQFAILYRGQEKISMSTRGGQFVTLRELRTEVGNDAARYFYVMRKPEQHLDFDLELAKSHNNENPIYYIQYAHARICSVLSQCESLDLDDLLESDVSLLVGSHERELLKTLDQYPATLLASALKYEPHTLAGFLHGLASQFHSYYNASQFLVDDTNLRNARLACIVAVGQVLKNGLGLLGLNAPEKM
jgi:arginyl-tRNA synthetase